jgi:hypothetical protein
MLEVLERFYLAHNVLAQGQPSENGLRTRQVLTGSQNTDLFPLVEGENNGVVKVALIA